MPYENLTPAMQVSLIEWLRQWHDFYALIGSAAATLVGLMFVAASIGAGVFTREHQSGIRSFLSPTVVHFSAILIISLIAIVPSETWQSAALFLVIIGVVGLGYCGSVWRRMIRHGLIGTIDNVDRFWYALLPTLGYGLTITCGVELWWHREGGLELLAVAMMILLLVGLRNSWDMTLWIIGRRG
jgi:hypothetical protein